MGGGVGRGRGRGGDEGVTDGTEKWPDWIKLNTTHSPEKEKQIPNPNHIQRG